MRFIPAIVSLALALFALGAGGEASQATRVVPPSTPYVHASEPIEIHGLFVVTDDTTLADGRVFHRGAVLLPGDVVMQGVARNPLGDDAPVAFAYDGEGFDVPGSTWLIVSPGTPAPGGPGSLVPTCSCETHCDHPLVACCKYRPQYPLCACVTQAVAASGQCDAGGSDHCGITQPCPPVAPTPGDSGTPSTPSH